MNTATKTVITLLVLVGAFYAFNSYIYTQKQQGADGEPYRGTLSGEAVCLPHKDPTLGTKECALGMKTDVGEHYVLDLTLLSQEQPAFQTGDRFTATGLITPIERLSTDQWQNYAVVGVFSVTDSVERLGSQGRYMDIETYVKTAISDLSPIKETVGGKFYVTSIETNNGKGVVSYEDGHNAYTADFTYSVNAEGKPTIVDFIVRK